MLGDIVRVVDFSGPSTYVLGDAMRWNIGNWRVYHGRKWGGYGLSDTGCGCCAGGIGQITHVWRAPGFGEALVAAEATVLEVSNE
jgi:hypothetical protein